jgi:hypothetical protein
MTAYESKMSTLKKLQSALDTLNTQRSQVVESGCFLQHCWLVQVKPGGTARTNAKYWQVRSRQPIFDGKTLKHLKPEEVEDYRAAIERGRVLKQLDLQIEKLQQKIAQLIPAIDSEPSLLPIDKLQQSKEKQPIDRVSFTNLAEQERLVKEVLANSQALRASLRQSLTRSKRLGVSIDPNSSLKKRGISRLTR